MNASLTLRSIPPLVFLFLIGVSLVISMGHYQPLAISLISLGFLAFATTAWPAVERSVRTLSPRLSGLLPLLVLLIFSASTALRPNIIYPKDRVLYLYFHGLLQIIAILIGLFVLMQVRKIFAEKTALRWFVLLVGAFFYARFFVLGLSPNPFIDVFTTCSLAAEYLLHGMNPYIQDYPDIYGGAYNRIAAQQYGSAYNYVTCMQYGPLYLYLVTPFRLLQDIRWAYIAADALTLTALWRIGSFLQWKIATRSLLCILWLAFPVSLFVLEQSWIDPLLVAALAWIFCLLLERKILAVGIALGIACGIKHYGAVPTFFVVLYLWKTNSFKAACQVALTAAAVFLGAQLPFLIWDAHALIQSTWTNFLSTPPRQDALTLWSWIWNSFDSPPAKSSTLAVSLFLIALVVWNFWRSAPTPGNLTRALVLAFSILFLFGYQAFCNYYYLLAFLVFLDLIFSLVPATENEKPESIPSTS